MKNKCLGLGFVLLGALALLACSEQSEPLAPDAASDVTGTEVPLEKETAQAPVPQGAVVARVNGVDLLRRDYEGILQHAERSLARGAPLSASDQQKLERQILQKMIQDELMIQHAFSLGLSVSTEDLQARAKVLVNQGGGQQALASFLASSGMDEKQMMANLRRNMLIELLHERIKLGIQLDEAALRAHYEKLKGKYSGAGEVELAHIVFKEDAGGKTPAQQAEALRAELDKDLKWDAAVAKYGKQGGGLLGRMQPADMLPVFAKAIEGLSVGQVSQPVESPMGVHLLYVVSKADGPLRSFEELREQVKKDLALVEFEKRMASLLDELSKKGDVRTTGLP